MLAALEKRAAARKERARLLRESEVEGHLIGAVKDRGGLALKFVSPGRRDVTDRIVLLPVPIEHQRIVARYLRFTEVKRPGEVPRPSQLREHERMRAMGFCVDVFDTKEAIDHAYPET